MSGIVFPSSVRYWPLASTQAQGKPYLSRFMTTLYLPVKPTVTSGTFNPDLVPKKIEITVLVQNEGASFVSLGPVSRVIWLAKNDFIKFTLLILTVASGVYLSLPFIVQCTLWAKELFISLAHANDEVKTQNIYAANDAITPVLLGFVGISLIVGALIWITSKDKAKSDQGFEVVKTLGVAAMGFIAGAKKG